MVVPRSPEDQSNIGEPEGLPAQRTFVVRLALGPSDDAAGTIEHLRTGERRRFRGLAAIGPVIGSMLELGVSEGQRPAKRPDGL